MAIRNTAQPQRSYFAGLIASDAPSVIHTYQLDYTQSGEVFATPSRGCVFVDAVAGTVKPSGDGVFAGIIVGNMRVVSGTESWYATGDTIELMSKGEIAVNFDDVTPGRKAPVVGGKVFVHKADGKIVTEAKDGDAIEIPNACIIAVGVSADPQLAIISLNGLVGA